jgi:hypothetical protein
MGVSLRICYSFPRIPRAGKNASYRRPRASPPPDRDWRRRRTTQTTNVAILMRSILYSQASQRKFQCVNFLKILSQKEGSLIAPESFEKLALLGPHPSHSLPQ